MKKIGKNNKTGYSVLLPLLFSALLLAGLPGPVIAQSSSSDLVSIVVRAQTTQSINGTYFFSAYNASGFLVASTQTQYNTVSFMLPKSEYLFTITALQRGQRCYPVSYMNAAMPAFLPPCYWGNPTGEYGFMMATVTTSRTIDISTLPFDKIPASQVTVTAKYPNGTTANGASVSASVVGGWYWWGGKTGLAMYNQTNSGLTQLTVPNVPVVITVWSWIQVDLPKSQTTTQVTVGGEKVNVTVYWQPTYVGFAGSYLLLPTSKSVSIVLHVQQPDYWAMPYSVSSVPVLVQGMKQMGTIASGPGGIPSSVYNQFQTQQGQFNPFYVIPPLPSYQGTSTSDQTLLLLEAATSVGIVLAAVSLFTVARKR